MGVGKRVSFGQKGGVTWSTDWVKVNKNEGSDFPYLFCPVRIMKVL